MMAELVTRRYVAFDETWCFQPVFIRILIFYIIKFPIHFSKIKLKQKLSSQNRQNSFNSYLNIMLTPLEYMDDYRSLKAYNIVGIPNFVTKIFGKKTVSNK